MSSAFLNRVDAMISIHLPELTYLASELVSCTGTRQDGECHPECRAHFDNTPSGSQNQVLLDVPRWRRRTTCCRATEVPSAA